MFRRTSLPAVFTTLVLAAVLLPGLASAHDDHDHAGQADPGRSADCTPAVMKELRSAGDRFAAGCSLPGEDIAKLDDSGAVLPPGGQASKNMSLIANIPKQGAFAGEGSFNSDIAFKGRYAYAGNYDGFMVYDIKKPNQPEVVAQVVCPGSQNDVSVWKDLLVLSVDSSRSDDSCQSTTQSATEKESWEGVRVFDISDPANPQYIAAVETPCGSHTHTLAPRPERAEPLRLRLVVLPQRDLPRLPAAARRDQHREDPAQRAGGCVPRVHPGAVPRRRQPGRQRLVDHERLPRHHGVPVARRRSRCVHG